MIAVFARANHPHGYGYSSPRDYSTPGIGAHGYVVIGVRCRTRSQVDEVIKHVRDSGLDLPDTGQGRIIYTEGVPERRYERNVGSKGVIRWYSGGPSDWDYLFTVPGNKIEWEHPSQGVYGSRGDNRFCAVYDAKEVLNG